SLAPADFDTIHRMLDTVSALLADPNQPHATQVTEAISKLAQLETEGHQSISSLIETKSASQALAETTLQVSSSAPPVEHNASPPPSPSVLTPVSSPDEEFDTISPASSFPSDTSSIKSIPPQTLPP